MLGNISYYRTLMLFQKVPPGDETPKGIKFSGTNLGGVISNIFSTDALFLLAFSRPGTVSMNAALLANC